MPRAAKDTHPNAIVRYSPGASRMQLATTGRAVVGWFHRAWRAVVGFFRPRRATPVEQAIAELRAYNDNELADLGIGRSQIVDAVLHGRPGIERPAA